MKVDIFDFELDRSLIAKQPASRVIRRACSI